MKAVIFGMAILSFLILPACIGAVPQAELPEYNAGIAYGDKMAKVDAMHDPCIHRFPGFTGEMLMYLHRHERAMEGQRSAAFMKGFDHGYRREFFGYMNFYCGE